MIIFLYGDDTFRAHHKIKELKRSFTEKLKTGEDSISFIDATEADINKIKEKINSSSLFSSGHKRMIIIENSFLSPSLDEIFNYFNENKESHKENTIIFWEKKIKTKKGRIKKIVMVDSSGKEIFLTKKKEKWLEYLKEQEYVQEFASLSNFDISRWTKERFENLELLINNDALQLLISIAGNNLWQLDREINKLV
ncbi:hypothetical protein K8R62_03285, partial [bacterium]|nr:hypothetical protein [bacterium]